MRGVERRVQHSFKCGGPAFASGPLTRGGALRLKGVARRRGAPGKGPAARSTTHSAAPNPPAPRQVASVISSIYSLTSPPTPRRAPDGAASPRGAGAGAPGGAGSGTPRRTGWGRSVAAQESGLWNASPFHPASAEPTPRAGRCSSFTGGFGAPPTPPRAPSGRATPRRDGFATPVSPSPRGGFASSAASARCSSGSSRCYSPAGGLSAGYGRLPSDAALKLAALYA